MKRFARIFFASLAFGLGAVVPTLVATAWETTYITHEEPQERSGPRFVNPYGPPTQGSPYADRDHRAYEYLKKNPC